MKPIKRDRFLNELISKKENGLIKVVTGIRRCGKSYLLFNLFYEHLLACGVKEENIIKIALDDEENAEYRDPKKLSAYRREKLSHNGRMNYVFIDEIQYAIRKEDLKKDEPLPLYGMLNGLLRRNDVDVYVTGSNSKLLSKDVLTEFRGRGDEVRVFPLSFGELYGYLGGDKAELFEEYALYGGLPLVLSKKNAREKTKYLSDLFKEVYFKDIEERYSLFYPDVMAQLTDELCSSVGSLTNASKLARSLKTAGGIDVTSQTVSTYLNYLQESFLFGEAKRYDVKGKKYFSYPSKYYCTDPGLRNVRIGFRQQEETHIMENIVYNELLARGYTVDIGVVESTKTGTDGNRHLVSYEIDFVAGDGNSRYYIQSALNIEEPEKEKSELRPLLLTSDFFKKIVVTKTRMKPWYDEQGILHVGLYDFLLDESFLSTK